MSNIKYGKLSDKVAGEIPWNKLFLDLLYHIDLKNLRYNKEVNKEL